VLKPRPGAESGRILSEVTLTGQSEIQVIQGLLSRVYRVRKELFMVDYSASG
jgi:hypothetical protein